MIQLEIDFLHPPMYISGLTYLFLVLTKEVSVGKKYKRASVEEYIKLQKMNRYSLISLNWTMICFRDEKQMDLAEQLESVAYVLCGDDRVTLDKFCQIFQAKGVSSFHISMHDRRFNHSFTYWDQLHFMCKAQPCK